MYKRHALANHWKQSAELHIQKTLRTRNDALFKPMGRQKIIQSYKNSNMMPVLHELLFMNDHFGIKKKGNEDMKKM